MSGVVVVLVQDVLDVVTSLSTRGEVINLVTRGVVTLVVVSQDSSGTRTFV